MTMSNRPRVLTEQDAGTMDTLIRRGEQAATVAEQKTQQLQDAAADLEQVKGTIPAAAQSAAALATAQAKATLDAAALNATTAATQATLALATLPKFRSPDTSNPPAPTQAELDANPNGLGGTRLTADGATQPLRWTPHTLAGAWVTMGAPTATAPQVEAARALAAQADTKADSASSEVLKRQLTIDGVADYAHTEAHEVANGAPVRGRQVLDMTRKLRVYGNPYGQYDNSTMLAVFANPERMPAQGPAGTPPRTTVLGFGSRDELSTYTGRDGVAAFFGHYGRPVNRSTPATTTYTATTVTAPGADLSAVQPGMIVDTEHGPPQGRGKWSGFIQSVEGNVITVDQWSRLRPDTGAVEYGTPANGTACRINPETQIFPLNVIAWLAPDAEAMHGHGAEIDVMNYKRDYDPTDADGVRVELDGQTILSTGGTTSKRNRYGANIYGNWWYGIRVSGAKHSGYAVEPGVVDAFTGARGDNPEAGFRDDSLSQVAFRASRNHIIAVQDVSATSGASYSAEGSGPVGVQVVGDYPAARLLTRGSGVAHLVQSAGGATLHRVDVTPSGVLHDYHTVTGERAARITAPEVGTLLIEPAPGGGGRVQVQGRVWGDSFHDRATGQQIVGARQPAIADSNGTAADNARAINGILAAMRAHGLIE